MARIVLERSRDFGGDKSRVALIIIAIVFICTLAAKSLRTGRLGSGCVVNNKHEIELFIVRSLMDTCPTVGDINGSIALNEIAIYPAAHTDDNVPSIADGVQEARAALRTPAGGVVKVLMHDVDNAKLQPPIPNFSGTAYTYKLLKERGVVENVEWIPDWHENYKGMNSLNEMERLVLHCKDIGIRALVVVSTPYHIPRSFLSALSVASRVYPGLFLVYAQAARPRE